jgi:hypothetical protein
MLKLVVSGCLVARFASVAAAGPVGASGFVFNEFGAPVFNGLVVVGTFAPSFDPHTYTDHYGDEFNNLLPDAYTQAVADGNFIPIASDFTDLTGFFASFGNSSAVGSQVWMFAFSDPVPDTFFQVLASTNASNWFLQPGSTATVIEAIQADDFELGLSHPLGVMLSVIPFPEPSAISLAMCGLLSVASLRRARTSRHPVACLAA